MIIPLKLVITVGLPASGKSTYLQQLAVNPISSDELRRQIADDPSDQTNHPIIFATIRYLIRQRIAVGRPITYVDATHLTRWERRPYILLARRHGCELEAIFFDVPLEVCLQRNWHRPHPVPEQAIHDMAARLQPPTEQEGFTQVIHVGQVGNLPPIKNRPLP